MINSKLRAWAAPLALVALNSAVTLRLFGIPYIREMGSIEAAYIGLARYIRAHFGEFQWFPLWYGGIPFQDAYPPLLHFIVAAAAWMPPGLAYHAVVAAVYAAAPAALYWSARRLGAAPAPAFMAGVLYSLISPSCWLVREVRGDSFGWFGPRRLVTLVRYGEGPHLLSMLFLPVAIALLHVALEKRKPLWYMLAALAMAAVVLSNWIGGFALALSLAAYLLAGFGGVRNRWLPAAAIGCWAYAMAVPWIPPSTIATIRANAPLVQGRFESDLRHKLFVAALVVTMLLLAWALSRWKFASRVRFGMLFVFGMAAIALGGWWFHLKLLPQPERYHLEMDLAFWLLVALALPARPRPALWAALALVCVPVAVRQAVLAHRMSAPIKIESTVEYRISKWLASNLPGQRVFAPGTIGFWMNAFSDTPMLTGGFDNGIRNTFLQDVNYQIYAGDRREIMLDWLKAFGCDAVVGGGPDSREVYHPYAHPGRFAGLQELWREGGDVIYAVPRARRSLAHAVRASDLVPQRPPNYDSAPLAHYLAALDDPALPDARLRWLSPADAEIVADLHPDHLLSVQVTWDPGWSAQVNGEARRAWGDTLGQMVVEPRCDGPCTVRLRFDGGGEMRFARALSGAALGGGVLWILLAPIMSRRRSASTRKR